MAWVRRLRWFAVACAGILRKVVSRVHKLLERRGAVDDAPLSALAQAHAQAAQARLLPAWAEPEEPRPGRRAALCDGYSLHAGTFVHENDRAALERLLRYGARPPLAQGRLSRLEDGRICYQVKRHAPRGPAALVLEPLDFLKRLAALVPPPRAHLVRYSGVFGPAARLRDKLCASQPRSRTVPGAPAAAVPGVALRLATQAVKRARRLDWAALLRRAHAVDVLACQKCGGRMTVIAFVTAPAVARTILEHLRLPAAAPPQAPARGPPQEQFTGWDQGAALN